MTQADQIRSYARERYVAPARRQRDRRFSIRTGDILRGMGLGGGRAPAACSALKTSEFLEENGLRLVSRTGPESGQSTTVVYTYEFTEGEKSALSSVSGPAGSTPQSRQEAWNRLRGALKDVFAEYGGGEAYLRSERTSFRDPDGRE